MNRACRFLFVLLLAFAVRAANIPKLEEADGGKPRNIIFVLVDDLRFDALGFMGHPWIETPHIDSLAKNGMNCRNAFVTTALCSPSRASLLTGLYAHRHRVVDNNNPVDPNLVFFSQYLKQANYQTAFVGKWHMGGESDAPQRGWDHWVSFRGQGVYYPGPRSSLNVNGRRVPQKGYITDELTDYALEWLNTRDQQKPFMLYLSHKAVHAEFYPAERHKGRYNDKPVVPPASQANTAENYRGKPMWVKNQRNSWHGVDFPYHSNLDVADYYRRYCETLLAVDDSVGRLLEFLKKNGLYESTLVVFMGDNGFMFGEHGLIDKRAAYEESMRVPLVMQCPELFQGGTVLTQVVANIDIAPTFLHAAGLKAPVNMDGKSFLRLHSNNAADWRDVLLYEYYWERNFPHTPTMHALRGDQFKYIRYTGLWDTDELYDIQADPREMNNLIRIPKYSQTVRHLNRRLWEVLEESGGMQVPLLPDAGGQQNLRRESGSKTADFPDYYLKDVKENSK